MLLDEAIAKAIVATGGIFGAIHHGASEGTVAQGRPSWIASAWTNVGADRIVLSLACFSTHQVLVSAATRLARINAVLRVRAVTNTIVPLRGVPFAGAQKVRRAIEFEWQGRRKSTNRRRKVAEFAALLRTSGPAGITSPTIFILALRTIAAIVVHLKAGEFAVSGGALKDPKVTGIRRAAEGSAAKGTRFAGPKFLIRTVRTVTEVVVHIEDWDGAVAPRTLEKRFKAR